MLDSNNSHQLYLYDLANLLRDNALGALAEFHTAKQSGDAGDKLFQEGRLLAYYEVLSLIKNQAESFQIPPEDLNWGDFDPDRDLLNQW